MVSVHHHMPTRQRPIPQSPTALCRLMTGLHDYAGNEGQGTPPLYAMGYSGKRRSGSAVNDQSTSSFPGVFEFPEANHGI